MRDLSGKGWRVLGYFVWMLGTGIVLDSSAWRTGLFVLLGGAGMFAFGLFKDRQARQAAEEEMMAQMELRQGRTK